MSSTDTRTITKDISQIPPTTLWPALTNPFDRLVSNAAYWHSLSVPGPPHLDHDRTWSHGYKSLCRTQFWASAREDETLMQCFLAFAAAKESTVLNRHEHRAYFAHKGKALQMIKADINKEGIYLRQLALGVIGVLSLAAFTEGDYEAAELHAQAAAKIAMHRLSTINFMVFMVVAMADLRLTGIYKRAPYLPYHIHADMGSLNTEASGRARFFAACNALSLPHGPGFLEGATGQGSLILERLHELALVFDSPDHDYLTVGPLIYDTAYRLAELQVELSEYGSWAENIALLAYQMQFWGTCKSILVQAGIQERLLRDFTDIVGQIQPAQLPEEWLRTGGRLNLLLWVLCNAFSSALHRGRPGNHGAAVSSRLLRQLHHVCKNLGLASQSALGHVLKEFPFVKHWNGLAEAPVLSCLQTGRITHTPILYESENALANLRITFE